MPWRTAAQMLLGYLKPMPGTQRPRELRSMMNLSSKSEASIAQEGSQHIETFETCQNWCTLCRFHADSTLASQGWSSMTFKWTLSQAQARCLSSRRSLASNTLTHEIISYTMLQRWLERWPRIEATDETQHKKISEKCKKCKRKIARDRLPSKTFCTAGWCTAQYDCRDECTR